MVQLDRRALLIGAAVSLAVPGSSAFSLPTKSIHVVKGRGCGCCTAWVKILQEEGFHVTEEEWLPADLVQLKRAKGIPAELASCHTAEIMGYVIEGHVPAADIRRLIEESPEAIGLSVPGMPYGSPGMGPEDAREAYDVILIRTDGTGKVFSSYPAAS
ncbi:MAG: DUF411 domain-containing protein [Roseibium sp.]|nr:DUF411 domain-containing protein [Roseibium sp.]